MLLIPDFTSYRSSFDTVRVIQTKEWAVAGYKLIIKDTNMVLQYGTASNVPYYQAIAEQHNANILMGVSDAEYNEGVHAYLASKVDTNLPDRIPALNQEETS